MVSCVRTRVLGLNSFGNLPDDWYPHSSFYVLYVIEEKALKTYLICSNVFYSKGKSYLSFRTFFFYHSWVEVIPCKNQLAISELAICRRQHVYTYRRLCAHTNTWPVLQFEYRPLGKFLLVLQCVGPLDLRNMSFHTVWGTHSALRCVNTNPATICGYQRVEVGHWN